MRRRYMSNTNVIFDNSNYMTINALEDGVEIVYDNSCEYGVNGVGWYKYPKNSVIILNSGESASFRNISNKSERFHIKGQCELSGNVMSLLFGDNAKSNKDLTGYPSAFSRLFESCTGIRFVSRNFLPATTLARSCYSYMFYDCTSLTTAPDLPATTLAEYCYYRMFSYCTNLTAAPKLPSTKLESYCYNSMFYDCTSLTTAPELPATTLASSCYEQMFYNCTSLTAAPELPATTLAYDCYEQMFYNCTSLTAAPELPATTLAKFCYSSMFWGCSKLNYIKMLATDISASYCLLSWVNGVSSTGTFIKNPAMTTLPTATSFNNYTGIPEGWTVVNDGEESGGKIVNTIVLRPYVYKGGKFNYLSIDYEISYPITSDIEVTFYTNGLNQKNTIYFFDYSGQNGTFTDVDMNPESAEIQVISIDPQEDDTYIYDVVIEY